MEQRYFFQNAKWVGAPDRTTESFSVLRGHFFAEPDSKAELHIIGLGFFKCYINGKCVNPDTFLPLSSDYEGTCDPDGEVLSGHRIYVPQFDISEFVKAGDNVIAIHYGGGWYGHQCRVFGLPKAIYCISVMNDENIRYYTSDENCRVGKGYAEQYKLQIERQNLLNLDGCLDPEFDDGKWPHAIVTESLDTEYCVTDCPPDALIKYLPVRQVRVGREGFVYDCGQNTTGYPVLELHARKGDLIRVIFSEELLPDGNIDRNYGHSQEFSVVSDGRVQIVQPEFTWFGFRCFEIAGNAEPKFVKVIHADIPVTATFDCDNETINWIFRTFTHSMLSNMHTGHPSDCPQLERRGYTGDGQLTCHAALTTLGAKAFYEKWLQDIADGQDKLSGHIQYTAPYFEAGGGPGGWGSAIVEVAYQLYRHFGDRQILEKYYCNMRRYLDYLEVHSEFGLVTSDKEGQWCLGEWCCPGVVHPDKNIPFFDQQVILPAPFLNTYFMVKSLKRMCEIARVIGKEEDVAEYERKAELRKKAITAAYFNAFDGNFFMGVQGANAFAVELGLGNENTYPNMVRHYKLAGTFDTGIFGTDILIRVLFEKGDGELAVDLLTNDGSCGYRTWKQYGATTFFEYWDCARSRSHNHPMFGAPAVYLFEYLLGIKQVENTAGYSSLIIAPQAVSKFGRMSGSIRTPEGTVAVSYEKIFGNTVFKVTIPPKTKAVFRYNGQERSLAEGENKLSFPNE